MKCYCFFKKKKRRRKPRKVGTNRNIRDLKENEEVHHAFGGEILFQLGRLHLQVQWVPIIGSLPLCAHKHGISYPHAAAYLLAFQILSLPFLRKTQII